MDRLSQEDWTREGDDGPEWVEGWRRDGDEGIKTAGGASTQS